MEKFVARVVSVHAGDNEDLSKEERSSIDVALDGVVGDRHRSYVRETWEGDKQPQGTKRRNERQWSAVSVEELRQISETLNLEETISASSVGANVCFEGIAGLSQLPKGTLLKFPSGAELQVEEYNPPCLDMGKRIASRYDTRSGDPLGDTAFSKAAKLTRGIVGVVEAAGVINAGDEVTIRIYETPAWLAR